MSEVAVATTNCPKCGATRREDDSRPCPRCGLAAERMAEYAEQRDATISDALTQQWERTLESWQDESRHDELLRLITSHEAYAWGAAKYRDTLRARPEDAYRDQPRRDEVIAERQLERLRKAAEVTMLASASVRRDRTPKPYRAVASVLAMLIIIIIAGLLVTVVMRQIRSTPTLPSATPAKPQQAPPPSTK